MAGGGSFISFPAMLGVGVPPVQANATNTVALWPGQAVSLVLLRADPGTGGGSGHWWRRARPEV